MVVPALNAGRVSMVGSVMTRPIGSKSAKAVAAGIPHQNLCRSCSG